MGADNCQLTAYGSPRSRVLACPPVQSAHSTGEAATPDAATFRAHARHALHLRATVKREDSAWQSDATVLNVGLGGACIALARSPNLGSVVTITFSAPSFYVRSGSPSEEPFTLRADVRWHRAATASEPARGGLAFEHTSPHDLQLLVDFLATL